MLAYIFLLVIFPFWSTVLGYRFSCIEFQEVTCECDTDEELIDCNSRGWKQFPTLINRLRGFSVMTLAFNDIAGPLPEEAEVLQWLPDLELLDLRGNDNVECKEIFSKFDRINVHSHCIEEELAKQRLSSLSPKPPPIFGTGRPKPTPLGPNRKGPYVPPFFPAWTASGPRRPAPCLSMWCKVQDGLKDAYVTTYSTVNRAWVKMKREFMAQQENLRKLLGLFPHRA